MKNMKVRKLVWACLILLLIPVKTYAQQAGIVGWIQDNVTSTNQAAAFEMKLYQTVPAVPPLTTPTVTTFILTNVSCAGPAPSVNCTAPKPAALNTSTGVRFEITARDSTNNTLESARSLPFFLSTTVPTALSITR